MRRARNGRARTGLRRDPDASDPYRPACAGLARAPSVVSGLLKPAASLDHPHTVPAPLNPKPLSTLSHPQRNAEREPTRSLNPKPCTLNFVNPNAEGEPKQSLNFNSINPTSLNPNAEGEPTQSLDPKPWP